MDRTVLHILGGDSRTRAEQARIVFALGHHAEIYSGLDELFERPPVEGIIMAADEGRPDSARQLIGELAERGIWLPVLLTSPTPAVEQIVAAIKAGVLDYYELPLEMSSFAGRLNALAAEATRYAEDRRRAVEARRSISSLSRREHQVLELLSAGCANKEIARRLSISPRTVEIHRGNMMGKLGAGHLADAVHIWVDAQPSGWTPPTLESEGELPVVAGRIGPARASEDPAELRRQRQ